MNAFQSGKLKKAITFSFDDGTVQDIQMIELMNRYGIKGTFNLNSELLGQGGLLRFPNPVVCHYKIRPEDVRDIYQGHEIAVHTLTHVNLIKQTDEEVIRQVEKDRLNLSDLAGYEVVGMAYPCGGVNHNDHVAKLIQENTGVLYSRTTVENHSFDLQENLFRFSPTVYFSNYDQMIADTERFFNLETNKPQILYIWGHAFEQDLASDRWQKLEDYFKLISGRSDIFYGTNKEVLLAE